MNPSQILLHLARLSLALAATLLPAPQVLAGEGIEFHRAEPGTLHFTLPAGQKAAIPSLRAEIYGAQLLGKMTPPQNDLPYFIFSGRPCADCERETSLFIVQPTPSFKPVTLTYPGKLFDPKTRSVVMESRAFVGKCLKKEPFELLVVFQKERVDRRHQLQSSVLVVQSKLTQEKDPAGGALSSMDLRETLFEKRLPKINDTLQLVKQKLCREIDGRSRFFSKKTFEIKTRFKQEEDADDSEGTPEGEKDLQSSSNATPPANGSTHSVPTPGPSPHPSPSNSTAPSAPSATGTAPASNTPTPAPSPPPEGQTQSSVSEGMTPALSP